MTTVFLLIVFLLQLVGFYFLAILYAKVQKFHDLEHNQQKLMDEMENTMSAYLSELKDENDRLLRLLEKREEEKLPTFEEQPKMKEEPIAFHTTIPKKPINLALKSYKSSTKKENSTETAQPLTDQEHALKLRADGYSIEQIAKQLKKGKTEVELLLKFSQ